jgi:hypothetical protein
MKVSQFARATLYNGLARYVQVDTIRDLTPQ